MRALITGANGKLGSELKKYFNDSYCPDEEKMDITNPKSVSASFEAFKPELVIHCAALTNVSFCEKNPFEAYYTNTIGTFILADACDAYGIKMVYISTDHVFDGSKGDYKEWNLPNPRGHYAKSKLAGEWMVLANPDNLVIRTSFMRDFLFEKAYTDKYFSGEVVGTIARWINQAIAREATGLYHIAGEKKSIYDLAKTLKPTVKPMLRKDRPKNDIGLRYLKDTSLDVSKWKKFSS